MALWQIRTRIRDEPGTLAKLAAALTTLQADIVSVDIHSADLTRGRPGAGPSGRAHDDLYVEVPEHLDAETLRLSLPRQLTAEDLDRTRVRPARPDDLRDGPSRALDLAARLASEPESLPHLLCRLIGGDAAELSPVRPPDSPHLVVVAVPWFRTAGGDVAFGQYVVVRRAWAPFSLTERTRAERFVATAAAIESERLKAGTRALLADGTEIRVQLGTHNDRGRIGDLLERSGGPPRARHDRSGDLAPAERRAAARPGNDRTDGDRTGIGGTEIDRRVRKGIDRTAMEDDHVGWLEALVTPPGGFTYLAYAGKTAVGMAQCLPDDEPGRSEVAVLVAEAWRRRGIGTLLLRQVIRQALVLGVRELAAITAAENTAHARLFARAGLPVSTRTSGGVRELVARLDVPAPQLG